MAETIIAEGKTTNEAIENGLKKLNVSKNMVDIKVLEEENKKSFFSILAPRVVKVELTVKEKAEVNSKDKKEVRETVQKVYEVSEEDVKTATINAERFVDEFIYTLNQKIEKEIKVENNIIEINFKGPDSSFCIGYRGENLKAIQTIISAVANKNLKSKVKVIVDAEGYREKREKTLEALADKVARTVLKTGKSVKLEPMSAYERKIIHSRLQTNDKVKTYSVGEEPHRRLVVEKN